MVQINLILSAIAGFLSGMLGSMGLGGGGILIICLTLLSDIPQTTAQGINLIFFIPIAIIAVIYYIKKHLINFKVILMAIPFGIIGAIIGAFISSVIDSSVLGKIFAVLLLIMGIIQILGSFKSQNKNTKSP